jgi:hypothetical protein
MPHPPWEDLATFFDPDDFATTATIRRAGEIVGEVLGIYDDPNHVSSLGDYDLDHPVPKFTCAEVDTAGFHRGDTVEIEGTTFDLMEEPSRDGTGISVLILGDQNVIYNAGI